MYRQAQKGRCIHSGCNEEPIGASPRCNTHLLQLKSNAEDAVKAQLDPSGRRKNPIKVVAWKKRKRQQSDASSDFTSGQSDASDAASGSNSESDFTSDTSADESGREDDDKNDDCYGRVYGQANVDPPLQYDIFSYAVELYGTAVPTREQASPPPPPSSVMCDLAVGLISLVVLI